MSASSKKKLRNEQNAAKMTERQLQEQKEAKKLKLLTISFTAVLALILVVAITFAGIQFVANSGIREKNAVALTVGDTKLTNAQLNYFFVDAAFEYANTYGMYASLFGLDLTQPLDQQVINTEDGSTWADEFTAAAISNAQATYALCAEAKANGFTLSQESQAEIDNAISTFELYATLYGYSSVDEYVQAYYGRGASVKGFREYSENNALAQEYYNNYANSLTYDEAALRAGEEGKELEFNNYTYNYYYLAASKFLTGGTTDAEGNTTYSAEEKAASVAAAEAAAKALAEAGYTSIEEFDAAIAALEINAELETAPKSSNSTDVAYSGLLAVAKDWITDASRKAGDMDYVEYSTTSTNEDGTEEKTINGYYVLYFTECNDNKFPLINVRHILVAPEGGTYDSSTGNTTYTAEEIAAARVEAEALLKQWQDGKATEDTFASLATELTDDPGSQETGGLYENVYPGQMVTTFNDWCFDSARQVGDTGIVETDYGCHVMYFSGYSDTSYRDFMIENTLMSADTEAWFNALVEACAVTEGNTKYLSRNMVLSTSN